VYVSGRSIMTKTLSVTSAESVSVEKNVIVKNTSAESVSVEKNVIVKNTSAESVSVEKNVIVKNTSSGRITPNHQPTEERV